jgi:phosphonate transport system permease protein
VVSRPGASRREIVAGFEVYRRRTLRAQRLRTLALLLGVSALLAISLHVSEVFTAAIGGDPLGRVASFLTLMNPALAPAALLAPRETPGSLAAWFYDFPLWLGLLWETVRIAIVATLLGGAGALAVSFLAARNLSPHPAVYAITRRTLELVRTLPDLILALILVAAFGVGPLPGVIALSIATMGSLGKLFAEANENIDMAQVEAVRATGAGWIAQMRFGVLPQTLANHASYALLRFEGNVAAAAALGIVGAGGIGVELSRAITYTQFDTYLALLLMIIALIIVIDWSSEQIRHRIIGLEGAR